jgi:hypothetical protein
LNGTGYAGFGYNPKPGEQSAPWTINEAEAKLIRDAAQRILSGTTAAQIVREWNEKSVPTSLGGKWTTASFRKVMIKGSLAGFLIHRGQEVGKGSWEPILDEDTYRRVQALFAERFHVRPHTPKGLLVGILYCASCDARLHQNIKAGGRVYGCNACGKSNVNADKVEALFEEMLLDRLGDPDFMNAMNADDSSADVIAALARVDAERELLKSHAAKLPVDVYVAKFDALEAESQKYRSQLERAIRPSLAWEPARLKREWNDLDTSTQRSLILDIVGAAKLTSEGTSGVKATRERLMKQLTPIPRP